MCLLAIQKHSNFQLESALCGLGIKEEFVTELAFKTKQLRSCASPLTCWFISAED